MGHKVGSLESSVARDLKSFNSSEFHSISIYLASFKKQMELELYFGTYELFEVVLRARFLE